MGYHNPHEPTHRYVNTRIFREDYLKSPEELAIAMSQSSQLEEAVVVYDKFRSVFATGLRA